MKNTILMMIGNYPKVCYLGLGFNGTNHELHPAEKNTNSKGMESREKIRGKTKWLLMFQRIAIFVGIGEHEIHQMWKGC